MSYLELVIPNEQDPQTVITQVNQYLGCNVFDINSTFGGSGSTKSYLSTKAIEDDFKACIYAYKTNHVAKDYSDSFCNFTGLLNLVYRRSNFVEYKEDGTTFFNHLEKLRVENKKKLLGVLIPKAIESGSTLCQAVSKHHGFVLSDYVALFIDATGLTIGEFQRLTMEEELYYLVKFDLFY